MIKLGITGGIGSGKSFVSHNIAVKFGFPVYDCDAQAKRLMCEHEGIRSDLRLLLGDDVYTSEGLNKSLLIDFLFKNEANAMQVNKIVHPRVKEDFREWAKKRALEGYELVVLESAILFESGFEKEVDSVLMVSAPLELRVSRVMERDHSTRERVLARIQAQWPDEKKCLLANFILDNGEGDELDVQLEAIFSSLKC